MDFFVFLGLMKDNDEEYRNFSLLRFDYIYYMQ